MNFGTLIMHPAFLIVISILFVILMLIIIFKNRYKIFTTNEFVLHFRSGKLKTASYGGGVFLLPIIDHIVVLSTAIQTVDISASEKVISKENQEIIVRGFIVWRITNPEMAFKAIGTTAMTSISVTLEQIVEAVIRTAVANMTLEQILRERSIIIESIMSEVTPIVDSWGVSIETVEVRDVTVVNQDLFNDLQAPFENKKRRTAQEISISTERDIQEMAIEKGLKIAKAEAKADNETRAFQAEQDQIAKVRELERDKAVVDQQRILDLTEQEKKRAVEIAIQTREQQVGEAIRVKQLEFMKIEMTKQVEQADKEQEQKTIDAQTALIQKQKNAEAEAKQIRIVAEAQKEQMIAEAEGKKAILLAEAEGLKEKVNAQNQINEAVLMQRLIDQLPVIASSMKVGDINWMNLGGSGSADESPLGIVPKNMMQVLAIGKQFGLDINGMLDKIRKGNGLVKDKKQLPEEQQADEFYLEEEEMDH
ncbi:MAG: SPFH domain-containing protein [Candidatus Kariarchaeaceae archaeon]